MTVDSGQLTVVDSLAGRQPRHQHLVPKLRLGTDMIEAPLRPGGPAAFWVSPRDAREAELRQMRSQAELGNEGERITSFWGPRALRASWPRPRHGPWRLLSYQ